MKNPNILKEIRNRNNLTLLDVAQKLGVNESTVQRYESGKIKNLKYEILTKLAEIYNTTPIELMGLNVEVNQNNNSGTISNNIGSNNADDYIDNSNTTNNNYYTTCARDVADNHSEGTEKSKDAFFILLNKLQRMSNEELLKMIEFADFILTRR